MKRPFPAIALIVLATSPVLLGQTIDFEKVPGVVTPIDGMAISNQFQLSNVVLPQSPYTWFDIPPPSTTNRFYRAVGLP